jgi:hypothetical protein
LDTKPTSQSSAALQQAGLPALYKNRTLSPLSKDGLSAETKTSEPDMSY